MITFGEAVSIHFNGEEIRAVHFPHGHTDGDSVIFFTGSNVVHMGDDFFVGRFPFVDLDSGGSVQGLIENIEKVLAQIPADAKIIPGHGPLSTLGGPEGLPPHARRDHRARADEDRGRQGSRTIQEEGLPEEWKEWGNGFIKTADWIALIHQSLTGKGTGSGSGTHHEPSPPDPSPGRTPGPPGEGGAQAPPHSHPWLDRLAEIRETRASDFSSGPATYGDVGGS